MVEITKNSVTDTLAAVSDPETGRDIVALGWVTGLVIKNGHVGFAMDVGDRDPRKLEPLRLAAESAVKAMEGVLSATVVLTAERAAPGAPATMPEPGEPEESAEPKEPKDLVKGVSAIIAVASGKGGVGKSTVATNLALAFHRLGLAVGLMDADIYGPSVPKMLGITERPQSDGKTVTPVTAFGIKVMSMGFLLEEETPTIWRGPMVAGAVTQLLGDVDWSGLDVLVVDMPPGTGDAQLTLAQKVSLAGAVIVSTPQDIALIDARKGINMFRKVDVPILGIIENMSVFVCPHCGEDSHIFGKGGAKATAAEVDAPFLGEIPLTLEVREHSDLGTPIVIAEEDHAASQAFLGIASKLKAQLFPGNA